ncbi:hypothetical protein [Streptomyces adelaidensis]|uniref:hypothetical protein n=1 Tax=Streptomyces adelaidensis TaxID=2796465 RepID=UPI0019033E92|nr:hypothetical protein [Streptomyces adelaidensis]
MANDGARTWKPGRREAETVDTPGGDGPGQGHGDGFRADIGTATTVAVIPLWDRPRTGVRG